MRKQESSNPQLAIFLSIYCVTFAGLYLSLANPAIFLVLIKDSSGSLKIGGLNLSKLMYALVAVVVALLVPLVVVVVIWFIPQGDVCLGCSVQHLASPLPTQGPLQPDWCKVKP